MSQRVLIADDSVLMRRIIADALIEDGWHVVAEACDGQEAIDLYRELLPDVVTLDIVMPEVNGLEALVAIREFDPEAKIVVVSALNQTRLISEAIHEGASDFIAKPFSAEELKATIRAVAESYEPVTIRA